jgi:hypothetical protein
MFLRFAFEGIGEHEIVFENLFGFFPVASS